MPRHAVRLRPCVPRFQREHKTAVGITFALRVGAHGIGPAQLHLFRDVQIFGGQLPAGCCVELGRSAGALQPGQVEAQLAVRALGSGGGGVRHLGRGVPQVKVASRSRDAVGVDCRTGKAVAVVALKAQHEHLNHLLLADVGGVHLVVQAFAVKGQLHGQVGLARTQQRVAAVDAGDAGRSVGLQAGEFLAEPVVEVGIGHADFCALDLHLVCGAGVVQAFARGQQAQACHVAVARGVVQIERAADAPAAGVAVAVVVAINAAGNQGPGHHVKHQVRAAHRGARREGGPHLHACKVAQQQQAAFQWCNGDGVVGRRLDQALGDAVLEPCLVANRDRAVATFQHGERDQAILDVLRRQVGPSQEIALRMVVVGHAVGQAAHVGQCHCTLRLEAAGFEQRGLRERLGTGNAQCVDTHAGLV